MLIQYRTRERLWDRVWGIKIMITSKIRNRINKAEAESIVNWLSILNHNLHLNPNLVCSSGTEPEYGSETECEGLRLWLRAGRIRLSDWDQEKGIMPQFDHEKLNVYQESIRFVAWTDDLLESIPKSIAAHNQLDRACTSVPLNIAEGNGKHTPADRCRFFWHRERFRIGMQRVPGCPGCQEDRQREQSGRGKGNPGGNRFDAGRVDTREFDGSRYLTGSAATVPNHTLHLQPCSESTWETGLWLRRLRPNRLSVLNHTLHLNPNLLGSSDTEPENGSEAAVNDYDY